MFSPRRRLQAAHPPDWVPVPWRLHEPDGAWSWEPPTSERARAWDQVRNRQHARPSPPPPVARTTGFIPQSLSPSPPPVASSSRYPPTPAPTPRTSVCQPTPRPLDTAQLANAAANLAAVAARLSAGPGTPPSALAALDTAVQMLSGAPSPVRAQDPPLAAWSPALAQPRSSPTAVPAIVLTDASPARSPRPPDNARHVRWPDGRTGNTPSPSATHFPVSTQSGPGPRVPTATPLRERPGYADGVCWLLRAGEVLFDVTRSSVLWRRRLDARARRPIALSELCLPALAAPARRLALVSPQLPWRVRVRVEAEPSVGDVLRRLHAFLMAPWPARELAALGDAERRRVEYNRERRAGTVLAPVLRVDALGRECWLHYVVPGGDADERVLVAHFASEHEVEGQETARGHRMRDRN